jgi:uncharacterized DUF497 family protein
MDVRRCLWSDYVIEKLARKHNLSTEEVEEALASRPRIRRLSRGHLKGEDVYLAYGRTEAGRYLTVFFVHKHSGDALIVSARDMDEKERAAYRRK